MGESLFSDSRDSILDKRCLILDKQVLDSQYSILAGIKKRDSQQTANLLLNGTVGL